MNTEHKTDGKLLLNDLVDLYEKVSSEANHDFKAWEKVIDRQDFLESASNLVAYLAIRRRDIRDIQYRLSAWGLSSLGRLESRTLHGLKSVILRLAKILDAEVNIPQPSSEAFTAGRDRLRLNTDVFFGEKPDQRNTRIMVTMPTEAAEDKQLLIDLIESGMNVARINCAHDNEEIWLNMINNLHETAKELDKEVKVMLDIAGPKIRTEWVFTRYKNPKVREGDKIRMTRNNSNLPDLEDDIKVTVGCSVPQVFDKLQVGDPVLIDDGSIELRVESVSEDEAILLIERVKGKSVRIRSEKGLNFPQTAFDIDVITESDQEAMKFAVEYADFISFSFIRTAKDIRQIQSELANMTDKAMKDIPIMLKIETVQAINNLAEVLLTAGSKNPVSVMIARGDLAAESGYVRLSEVQQEILWLCEASATPVVWGTEVLASMLDEGIPTRAEITDAGEGSRSECVMLNKGRYMADTVTMLDEILVKMEEHYYKKTPTFRRLNIAKFDNPE